jgi:hypothetical protein
MAQGDRVIKVSLNLNRSPIEFVLFSDELVTLRSNPPPPKAIYLLQLSS